MPQFSYYLDQDKGNILDKFIDEKRLTSKTALVSNLVSDFLTSIFFEKIRKLRDDIRFYTNEMRSGNIPMELQSIFRLFGAEDEKERMLIMNILIKLHNEIDSTIAELRAARDFIKKERESNKLPIENVFDKIDSKLK